MSSLIIVAALILGLVVLATLFGKVIGGIILLLGGIFAFAEGGVDGIVVYLVLVTFAGAVLGRVKDP